MVVERERTSGYLPTGCMGRMLPGIVTMQVEEEPEGVVVMAGDLLDIRQLAS